MNRFDEKVEEIAAAMSSEHGQAFRALVTRERERLFQEYHADHAAFRRRLGIPQPQALGPAMRQGQSVGELVVKTAVRATVWESVRALFHAFK